jgi:hypothetical protein
VERALAVLVEHGLPTEKIDLLREKGLTFSGVSEIALLNPLHPDVRELAPDWNRWIAYDKQLFHI